MDTGEGHFEMIKDLEDAIKKEKQYPNHGGIFSIGEIIELKGSVFKVKAIRPDKLILKLLKRR